MSESNNCKWNHIPTPLRELSLALNMIEDDPDEGLRDLVPRYLDIVTAGQLPDRRSRQAKEVMIVGAGLTGLLTGLLLGRAGHRVTILEANANRLGGRIKTFRGQDFDNPIRPIPSSLAREGAEDPRYGEAGAMRIPDVHPITLQLIDTLGLPRRPFYNRDVAMDFEVDRRTPPVVFDSVLPDQPPWRSGPDLDPPYRHAPPKDERVTLTNARRELRREYEADPVATNLGFEGEWGYDKYRTTSQLLEDAWAPVKDEYSYLDNRGVRVNKSGEDYLAGWARVIDKYDHMTLRDFLVEVAGLSDAQVAAIAVMGGFSGRLSLSFLHTFTRVSTDHFWEIAGGMDRMIDALDAELAELDNVTIRMNARLVALDELDDGRLQAQLRTEARSEHDSEGALRVVEDGCEAAPCTAEYAIITVPFSSLRFVDLPDGVSYGKRRSIAEMHYDAATKVLLRFDERWWDEPGASTGAGAVRGGGSVTDNPKIGVYYPSFGILDDAEAEQPAGGVLLASYCWADDARRWDSMDAGERHAFALRGVEQVHGATGLDASLTGHATQSWARNPYAFGEAAVYKARQLTRIHLDSYRPEGKIHFAGEHTSLKHAWIEGSLESAIRVALEVDDA
ncbi:MAG: FAD-dependent oxidoreductase [Myxococcales bacterium]|nr:FAD-dependent oxidoreductase [Myxococcales bacterium]